LLAGTENADPYTFPSCAVATAHSAPSATDAWPADAQSACVDISMYTAGGAAGGAGGGGEGEGGGGDGGEQSSSPQPMHAAVAPGGLLVAHHVFQPAFPHPEGIDPMPLAM
jgi:hypothetical protein